ncbi:sensor histidine kinase [Meridianimarinicoccus sp. RP-17]|uniref:sensor histidine kinase n=1 Tax=Meridianimarinicoccus zhengii TaxID=2056810 RepID=UPI000DAD12A1|nr:HAMP domain-containing sensor histidine kinase [Phycocomes zhengii]
MKPGSIRARLLAWSGGLTVLALLLAWLALSAVLSDFVDRRLGAELDAAARGVMAASDWDAAGNFTVAPPPADPRFERPLSGWYWQVADGDAVLARAPSLLAGDLGPDGRGMTGPDGAALVTRRVAFTAPGDGRALSVTVTLPAAEAAAELAGVRRPVIVALAVLGVALLSAQVAAVRVGLADLTAFTGAVARIRDGRALAVPQPRAAELRPLAAELDRLIAVNAAQLARARAHAGDLAHALKTPLAVLANRAGPDDADLIARMDRTIRWHLKRARATAAGLDPAAHCAVAPVLEDVAVVLRPEARRRGVDLCFAADRAPDFRGDAEDLAEILGALCENAVAWAAGNVRIAAQRAGADLVIEIEDDGPGIPAASRDRLMARGARLDETTQGHGLGLAIAADRAAAYGGEVSLGTGALGGLLARVTLPARD